MFATVGGSVVFVVVAIIILSILPTYTHVVPRAQVLVVERLEAYQGTYGVGIHFLISFIGRVAKRVSLKEQVEDFPPQPVITKDNVTMQIDTVVFFYTTGPKLYAYGVERPLLAIENLTATTLRSIIGDLELDQTLASRETVNAKIQESLDIATDSWGIKVTGVELKNIILPSAIQEIMEKQMKAKRERCESTLRAEGEKRFIILVVEDDRGSAVLNAGAEEEAAILRAEAEKEKKIKEAQGQARAIRSVQQATADGIRFIKETGADNTALQLKSLEASQAAADGKANEIIIPSDIQGIAGMVKSIAEIAAKGEGTE